MAISIVRVLHKNQPRWGVAQKDAVYLLSVKADSLAQLLALGIAKVRENLAAAEKVQDVHFLSPVTAPCQVVCQGLNYADHARELGLDPKAIKHNTLFTKTSASLSGARDNIQRPAHVELLDYEIELGFVLARAIEKPLTLSDNEALPYIAGLVLANDVSARDVQLREGQWFKAKSYRSFCPVGPYFCWLENDDFKHIYNLQMELKVNGEVRQKSSSAEQVFRLGATLSELSQLMSLNAGDLLITGTPGGVALKAPAPAMQRIARVLFSEAKALEVFLREQKKSPRYLKDGDIVEARIWNDSLNLGHQRCTVSRG